MDIKERGFVGNDEKLLLNWLMANQNGIEDNKILFGYQ